MNLVALYNVWSDSSELLEGSIKTIRENVDYIIAITQKTSNFGVYNDEGFKEAKRLEKLGLIDEVINYEPTSRHKEREKRQHGLNKAIEKGRFTHFLMLDCDEYYKPDEFKKAKKYIYDENLTGSVLKMYTYFRHKYLRLENMDNYYVPFIHKLKPLTRNGISGYPFWVDPTRKINGCTKHNTEYIDFCRMHHYSYVRKNIKLKMENSTARDNIINSTLLTDYENAKAGYYVPHFRQKLVFVA